MWCAPYFVALVACYCLHAKVVLAKQVVHHNEITLVWRQIFVNILDGSPTFSLIIELDETVRDLMRVINELEGLPAYWRVTTRGDTLELDAKLYEYNIQDGTVLTVAMPDDYSHYKREEFIVRTRDGRELPVKTQLDRSVSSLKDEITHWTGVPQAEQRLLLNGKELKDERKLLHYDIVSQTVLDLGRPLEECRQLVTIFIKTLSGATIEVNVNLDDTVDGLKDKLRVKTGVPAGVQRLSANERIIAGDDHLCDLGLVAGSTVYMYFYSPSIIRLNQVARLQEPPVANQLDRAPIFREVEDAREPVQSDHCVSLYKDARNWVVRNGPRPSWDANLFDPTARLVPNPDDLASIEQFRRILESGWDLEASEGGRMYAAVIRARIKLSLAVRSYRVAANLTSVNHSRHQPGVTLGGGSIDASPSKLVPLGADVNNWAPDAFSDSDMMRLFEMAERLRNVLRRGTQGTLSIAGQRRINNAFLLSYLEATAGYPPPVDYNQSREDEECAICRDDLKAEPAIKLACEHAFHADCLVSWANGLRREGRVPSCPSCRQNFIIAFQILRKAVLETPELQVDQI